MEDLLRAQALLEQNAAITCVFVCGGETITDMRRGVKPLLDLIDSGRDLSAFSAADKVVGRGAALLYALMGIKKLFAGTVSESAEEVLRAHNIYYQYGTRVPHIVNRKKDGLCPMEEATEGILDPEEGWKAIRKRLAALRDK